MIISASRRTDIPALYGDWFFRRLEEGFVFVRNPFNYRKITYVPLNNQFVDCFVFWTKNPADFIPQLEKIKSFPYYFLFTLNGYGSIFEKQLPERKELIHTFQRLSEKVSPERIIWRYDPIIFSPKTDFDFHLNNFNSIAKELSSFTHKCIISFICLYKKIQKTMQNLDMYPVSIEYKIQLINRLKELAQPKNIKIQFCAESEIQELFIQSKGSCIDIELIKILSLNEVNSSVDKNQREYCNCAKSIDIGEYNTCTHLCSYCYANSSAMRIKNSFAIHNPSSPILIGEICDLDKISFPYGQ